MSEEYWEQDGLLYYWANWCPFEYQRRHFYPIQQKLFSVRLSA
jgi:hypothetical protein